MLLSRKSKNFEKRMDSLRAELKSVASGLGGLNDEVKSYTDELGKEAEGATGRREVRLVGEVDRCDDLMDRIDDLAQTLGVELGPVPVVVIPVPVAVPVPD
jgi:hypothetical protein